MHRLDTRSTLLLLLSCLLCLNLLAQDGKTDSSFGSNGTVWDPPGPYTGDSSVRILVNSEGKILHLGWANGIRIVRYLPGGTIDPSFGTNGIVQHSSSATLSTLVGAALQPDGKIMAAGDAAGGLSVVRFNADGSTDAAFGANGRATVIVAPNNITNSMALQPDGAIVLAGTALLNGTYTVPVVRFHPNGAPDPSFDGDGAALIQFDHGFSGGQVAIQTDGKIVVAGTTFNPYQLPPWYPPNLRSLDVALARLLPGGTLDPSFDGDGRQSLLIAASLYGTHEWVKALAIQPDGKILVGSRQYESFVDGSNFLVARFNSDGSVDHGFTRTAVSIGDEDHPVEMALQSDGKILVGGYSTCVFCADSKDMILLRLHANGSPDAGFDEDGKRVLSLIQPNNTSLSFDGGGSIASQGNQLLVGGFASLLGQSTNKALLFRLQNAAPLLPRNPLRFYLDSDGDGFGSSDQVQVAYLQPPGYVSKGGDCNDNNTAVYPGAMETGDGLDNDCNGWADDSIHYTLIPAKIEAEAYGNMSGVQTEGSSDAGGGQNVGYIDQGDWMDYYIKSPGTSIYTVHFRVASTMDGASLQVYAQSGQLLATVPVPNTGGWQAWTTVTATLNLSQGNQKIRILSNSSAHWNLNWVEFVLGTTPPLQYVLIPARLQAEAFTTQSGTQNEGTSDTGGGENVGYIEQGDWLEYRITSLGGAYLFRARVASTMSGGSFELRTASGLLLATVAVPNTGSWQGWTTMEVPVSLPTGDLTVRLTSTSTANWNINWLEFVQPIAPPFPGYVLIPAQIEAEAWASMNGVQTEQTSDVGGGQNVGWIDGGDWLDYNIHATAAGIYTVSLRVASPNNGTLQVALYSLSGNLLATITVPHTGGWQSWTTVTAQVILPAGSQTIRVWAAGGGWNINWIAFSQSNTQPAGYVLLPARIEAESYAAQSGTQTEGTGDEGGGQNVGYIEQGDWLEYKVSVPTTTNFLVRARVSSLMSGGTFEIRSEAGAVLASFTVPNTGSWQTWTTVTTNIVLPAGNHTLTLVSTSPANWNINWIEFLQLSYIT